MLSDKLRQAINEIDDQCGDALEVKQKIGQLMQHRDFPVSFSRFKELVQADLEISWPALTEELQACLSGSTEPDSPVPAKPFLALYLKNRHKLAPSMDPDAEYRYLRYALLASLGQKAIRPTFKVWLNDLVEGKVALDSAVSERFMANTPVYQGVQYRGEHGDLNEGLLQTRLSQYSFSSEKVARSYAQFPNNRNDGVKDARLIEATITLSAPFVMEKSCFVDLSTIRHLFNNDAEWVEYAKGKLDHLCNTDNFYVVQEKYGLPDDMPESEVLKELVKQHGPQVLNEYYLDVYVVFDDPDMVNRIKALGYDGLAHKGNGESAMIMEYKVFFDDQIHVEKAVALHHAGDQNIPLTPRVTMADKFEGTLKAPLRRRC